MEKIVIQVRKQTLPITLKLIKYSMEFNQLLARINCMKLLR